MHEQANTLVEKGDLEGARTLYIEAAGIEPYCIEAIFNLGLVNLRLGEYPVRTLWAGACLCLHCRWGNGTRQR